MAGQKNECFEKKRPGTLLPRALRVHSPALAWLSLGGLLRSRARFRFTRRFRLYPNPPVCNRPKLKTSQTRPPGPAKPIHQPTLTKHPRKAENCD